MSFPTTPATFPTHVTGEIVRAAHVNAYADEIEAIEKGWLSTPAQTLSAFRMRGGVAPGLEWGDANAAGGCSTLGHNANNGLNFIGLHCEPGTTVNTFKTRGIPGLAIGASQADAFLLGHVQAANADNQALAQSLTITPQGSVTLPFAPSCRLRNAVSSPAIAINTMTVLSFDTEDADTVSMHTPGGSTMTIPVTGWYVITAFVRFAPQTGGSRSIHVHNNGAIICSTVSRPVVTFSTNISLIWVAPLNAGDVLDLRVRHTAVATIVCGSTLLEEMTRFSVMKVA